MHISACLLEGAVTTASLLCIRFSGAWGVGSVYYCRTHSCGLREE